MLLRWKPPPITQRNGDIVGYIVRVYNMESLVCIREIEVNKTTLYSVNGLNTSYPYNVTIAAKTVVGWGPFSSPSFIITLSDGKRDVCS